MKKYKFRMFTICCNNDDNESSRCSGNAGKIFTNNVINSELTYGPKRLELYLIGSHLNGEAPTAWDIFVNERVTVEIYQTWSPQEYQVLYLLLLYVQRMKKEAQQLIVSFGSLRTAYIITLTVHKLVTHGKLKKKI